MHIDCAGLFAFGQSHGRGGSLAQRAQDADLPYEELLPGVVTPIEPVAFRIAGKRRLGDVVGTGHVAPLVVWWCYRAVRARGPGDAAPQAVLPEPGSWDGTCRHGRGLTALVRRSAASGRLFPTFVRMRADRARPDLPG